MATRRTSSLWRGRLLPPKSLGVQITSCRVPVLADRRRRVRLWSCETVHCRASHRDGQGTRNPSWPVLTRLKPPVVDKRSSAVHRPGTVPPPPDRQVMAIVKELGERLDMTGTTLGGTETRRTRLSRRRLPVQRDERRIAESRRSDLTQR